MTTINDGGRDSRNRVSTHSYSGSDFEIYAYIDYSAFFTGVQSEDAATQELVEEYRKSSNLIKLGNLQTITTSMASSLSAVMNIGDSNATGFTRGQKTYAGSLIFTVLNKDPLDELLKLHTDFFKDASSDFVSADELPPLNIVIKGSSEHLEERIRTPTGQVYSTDTITKVIYGVRLMQHGETISIDDFFTEQTYQYIARHVTNWNRGTELPVVINKKGYTKNEFSISKKRPNVSVLKSYTSPDSTIPLPTVETSLADSKTTAEDTEIQKRIIDAKNKLIELNPTELNLSP